jgi:hypothetical protein
MLIDIKDLLKKLKKLIPEKWWSRWLKDILDQILDNLSPQDPEEFKRLLTFVEELYEPALREELAWYRREIRLEAYEKFAWAVLKDLLHEGLRKFPKKA